MPLYQHVVTCNGCNFRREPWAANADEAIWGCGVDPKAAKCPECGGQLKATTSGSPISSLEALERGLHPSWELADNEE